jgi:hypothetical protein
VCEVVRIESVPTTGPSLAYCAIRARGGFGVSSNRVKFKHSAVPRHGVGAIEIPVRFGAGVSWKWRDYRVPAPTRETIQHVNTTPLWIPLAVAALGVLGTVIGTIASVLITQRRADKREIEAWDRET